MQHHVKAVSNLIQTILGATQGPYWSSKQDPGLEGPQKDWDERLRFKVLDRTDKPVDGWYAVYSKEGTTPGTETAPPYTVDYTVMVWYPSEKAYQKGKKGDFSEAERVMRSTVPFGRSFQLQYNSGDYGYLHEFDRFWGSAVEANGHQMDYDNIYEFGEKVEDDDDDNGNNKETIIEQIEQYHEALRLSTKIPEEEMPPIDKIKELEVDALNDLLQQLVDLADDYQVAVEIDDDEVPAHLPPGAQVQTTEGRNPGDQRGQKPVKPITHERPTNTVDTKPTNVKDSTEVGEQEVTGTDPMSRLRDIASKIDESKAGKVLEVYLPNEIELTLKRNGKQGAYQYEITVDSWLEDEEFNDAISCLGGVTTKNQKKLTKGFGKQWLSFNKDPKEGWEIEVTSELSPEVTVELIERLSHVYTGQEARKPDDFGSLLEGLEFTGDRETTTVDPVDSDDSEEVSFELDDWAEFLGEEGFVQVNRLRWERPGKGSLILSVKLKKHTDPDLADLEYYQADVRNGSKKIGTFDSGEPLSRAIVDYVPGGKKSVSKEDRADADDDDQSLGANIVDTIWLMEFDGVNHMTVEGESDDAHSWLTQHGFEHHPAQWQRTIPSKSIGLRMLNLLEAAGIKIENKYDIVARIQGKTVKKKPYMQALREQRKELRRRPDNMDFSVHLTVWDDSNMLVVTDRSNNPKARKAFRKCRFEMDNPAFWISIKDKAAATALLRKMKAGGLQVADWEDFSDSWDETFGGSPGVKLGVKATTK